MAASKKAPAKSSATVKRQARGPAKARSPARPSRSGAVATASRTARRPQSRTVLARNAQKRARETAAQIVPADAIGLLERGHREADGSFAQVEQDEEPPPALARQLCL